MPFPATRTAFGSVFARLKHSGATDTEKRAQSQRSQLRTTMRDSGITGFAVRPICGADHRLSALEQPIPLVAVVFEADALLEHFADAKRCTALAFDTGLAMDVDSGDGKDHLVGEPLSRVRTRKSRQVPCQPAKQLGLHARW